tara:strand:+ start:5627 stop:5884 length:258 start_codon:yes stop_codon:yes gene_type:complete
MRPFLWQGLRYFQAALAFTTTGRFGANSVCFSDDILNICHNVALNSGIEKTTIYQGLLAIELMEEWPQMDIWRGICLNNMFQRVR